MTIIIYPVDWLLKTFGAYRHCGWLNKLYNESYLWESAFFIETYKFPELKFVDKWFQPSQHFHHDITIDPGSRRQPQDVQWQASSMWSVRGFHRQMMGFRQEWDFVVDFWWISCFVGGISAANVGLLDVMYRWGLTGHMVRTLSF